MKNNKEKGLSFILGSYSENLQRGYNLRKFYKKSMFYEILRRTPGRRGIYIRVNYGNNLYNDGVYNTKKDAKEAFMAFIEESLVRYALDGEL